MPVARARDDAGRQSVDATHDGYARSCGALHRRVLRLAEDGAGLAGEDIVASAGKTAMAAGKSLAVRFHLHPTVRAECDDDRKGVLLTLPSGERWRFEAEGRAIGLEESIFFAAPGGARQTTQIVLRERLVENERLGWSFTLAGTQPSGADRGS